MFTGIIEEVGTVVELRQDASNLHISVKCNFVNELKVDQSLAHNGVCLTVVSIKEDFYTVTAINETMEKSNLSKLKIGSLVNLERAMKLGDRLDGHLVQGHVDQTAICTDIESRDGSWIFTFSYDPKQDNITIEKGSITVNGVSLTVINSNQKSFGVAIIPFTYEHTNFHTLQVNDQVNIEFDVIGKYVSKLLRE